MIRRSCVLRYSESAFSKTEYQSILLDHVAAPSSIFTDLQTDKMKDKKSGCEKWTHCPPGIIQEASKEPSISRRNLFGIIGIGAVVGAVGGGAALGVIFSSGMPGNSNGTLPAGIACIQVHDNLAAYVAGKIKDSELKEQITYHLMKCENCREDYDGLCCTSKAGCGQRPAKATLRPCTL